MIERDMNKYFQPSTILLMRMIVDIESRRLYPGPPYLWVVARPEEASVILQQSNYVLLQKLNIEEKVSNEVIFVAGELSVKGAIMAEGDYLRIGENTFQISDEAKDVWQCLLTRAAV